MDPAGAGGEADEYGFRTLFPVGVEREGVVSRLYDLLNEGAFKGKLFKNTVYLFAIQ